MKDKTIVKSKNDNMIDLVKFLMSIIVIMIHVHPFENFKNPLVGLVFTKLNLFAVPFFFVVFGFYLYRKMSILNSEEKLCYLKDKIKKFIKLYFIWSLIYLPITIYGLVNNGYGILFDVFSLIRGYFIIGENFDSWPLWFLLSLIYSLVFLYFLEKIKVSKKKTIFISLVICVFGFCISSFVTFDSDQSFVLLLQKIIKSTIGSGRILYGLGYIAVGEILFDKFNKKIELKNILLLLLFLILIFTFNGFFSNFFNLFFMYNFVYLCLNLNLNIKKPLFFRKLSTVSYYTHMIFNFLFTLLIGDVNRKGMFVFLVVFIFTELFGCIVYRFRDKKIFKEIF